MEHSSIGCRLLSRPFGEWWWLAKVSRLVRAARRALHMCRSVAGAVMHGFGDADSYLVDPASSHMLVSKIKPCMSKHKLLHSEAANGSLGHP